MEQGKQGVMVAKVLPQQLQNPIEQLQGRFKELETRFRVWLSQQSLPVEAAVVTTTSAAQGAAIGAFMGTLTADPASPFPTPPPQSSVNPQAMASLKQAQVDSSLKVLFFIGFPVLNWFYVGTPLPLISVFALGFSWNFGASVWKRMVYGKHET